MHSGAHPSPYWDPSEQWPIGTAIGYFADSTGAYHGFVYDPNANNFTNPQLDCSGSGGQGTQLEGINSAGLAVGYYFDPSAGSYVAFTYDTKAGGDCTPLPCTDCEAFGINDAGWIVGEENASSNNPQGVVHKDGLQPIAMNLGDWSLIRGINGQGTITGYYYDSVSQNVYGFMGDASQGTITLAQSQVSCPSGYRDTYPGGINNNGQVVGGSWGPPVAFWFDPSGCSQLSAWPAKGGAAGLNDFAQIVGGVVGQTTN